MHLIAVIGHQSTTDYSMSVCRMKSTRSETPTLRG